MTSERQDAATSPSSSSSSLYQSYPVTPESADDSSDSHRAMTQCADTSSSSSQPCLPLRSPPCITFAPLPELSPRKRRHPLPLGVAARSQYLLNRRQQREMHIEEEMDYCGGSPMWGEEESGEMLEDPFLLLGRMVKVAGKDLWRSVRRKKKKPVDGSGADGNGGESDVTEIGQDTGIVTGPGDEPDGNQRPIEGEGALEENISDEKPTKPPSDETSNPLRDGQKFVWTSPS